ncbi:MAG: lactonase family protein [Pirellulaceae bacterium]|nr:lactonase family protein [Pirellulaceae bacterium]
MLVRRIMMCCCGWIIGAGIVTLGTRAMAADDVLVFVSAFAAGDEGAIHAYRVNTGTSHWELLHRTTDVEHPFFLALAPDERTLYAIHAPGAFGGAADEYVAAYDIRDANGQLQLLNRQSTRGSASCYLDVDASGKTVVVANYNTGSVAALPRLSDGSLGEITAFVQHRGRSVDHERQEGPHAHCAVVSPDNRLLLAADLGLDQVLVYQLDASRAQLTPHLQPFVRTAPGTGPRHLVFHPGGHSLYVINELAGSITHFSYLGESGFLVERETVPTLPSDYAGENLCADLKVTPDGKFLYGTNRGHDSIAAYRIDADGRLTHVATVPSGGAGPQNLAITPDGRLLLCANMPGNQVTLFRIDAEHGTLAPIGRPIPVPSPSCILLR